MENNKWSIYLLIWWALASLIVIVARMLGSFNIQEKAIVTNDIKTSMDVMPQSCRDSMKIMWCLLSSDQLSGSQGNINEWYQQLLSEWNTITNQELLNSKCSYYYDYLLSLQESGYQNIIQSCK